MNAPALALARRPPLLSGMAIAARRLLVPRIVLALLVVVVVSNASEVLAARGLPGVYWIVTALAAVVAGRGVRDGGLRIPRRPVVAGALVFVASQALSVFVASDAEAAVRWLLVSAHALAFLLLVMTLATAPDAAGTAGVAAVATLAALAFVTLVQEVLLHNRTDLGGFSRLSTGVDEGGTSARHAGPLADANFWARNLVLFLPLAASFAVVARSRRRRLTLWGCAGCLVVGVYLTQSRGAYLATGFAVLAWLLLAGPRFRPALYLAPPVIAAILLLPGVGSRLQTVDVTTAVSGQGDPSLVARTAVMRVAWAAFEANPLLGVGADNFQRVQPVYERQTGIDLPGSMAAHNLYLGLAVDSGMVGLAGWMVLFTLALAVPLSALRRAPPPANPRRATAADRYLLVGAGAGLAAWALAGMFLHLAQQHVLMVVVALGAVTAGRVSPGSEHRQAPKRTVGGLVAGATPILVALIVAAVGVALALPRRQVSAALYALVEPADVENADAYDFDVAGRRVVVESFAAFLSQGRFAAMANEVLGLDGRAAKVSVDAAPRAAVVIMSARTDDREDAEGVVKLAFDQGTALLDSVNPHYRLRPIGSPIVTRSSPTFLRDVVIACLAGLGAGQLAYFAVRRRTRGGALAHAKGSSAAHRSPTSSS